MKRFLAKILRFFLIITSVTLCVNFVYIKKDSLDSDNTGKFKSVPPSVTICNFGSSHGLNGFNYEDIADDICFNFALASQTLSYDRRLFDYYKGNISKGAVVFIPVSYFSLYGKDERVGNGFEEKNKRYYKILPPNLIKDYDRKTDIYVNYFPALYSKNVLKVLFGRTQRIDNVAWLQVSTDIDLAKDVKAAYERHIVTNKFDENDSRIVNQEELDSLKYIINSCKDMEAVPILLTTPYLQEYTDEVKKKQPGIF